LKSGGRRGGEGRGIRTEYIIVGHPVVVVLLLLVLGANKMILQEREIQTTNSMSFVFYIIKLNLFVIVMAVVVLAVVVVSAPPHFEIP
jgi:hypothetical protein